MVLMAFLMSITMKLFSDIPEEEEKEAEFTSLWQLEIQRADKPIKKINVTGFRDYLTCPFRYYLHKVLNMEDVVYESNEMDARDFGLIAHAVLEDFGNYKPLLGSTDAGEIRKFLYKTTDRHFSAKFGSGRPMTVMVQYESLLRRFAKFAEIQAEEVASGWRIIKTEFSLKSTGLSDDSEIVISGKLDRIEENINDGRIRILDYKTTDVSDQKMLIPKEIHLSGGKESTPEYAKFSYNGKSLCWRDLQLPLYAILLRKEEEYRDKFITCGYFNLHKTIGQTGINCWSDMDDYLGEAEKCVRRVLDNLSKNIYWPPSERIEYDNFERLFAGCHDLEEAVEGKKFHYSSETSITGN